MPDVRVYRAAFAPALVALFVAAFSLTDRPAAVTTPFAPAGFDGSRAFEALQQLGEAFPQRPAGSDADLARLGDRERLGDLVPPTVGVDQGEGDREPDLEPEHREERPAQDGEHASGRRRRLAHAVNLVSRAEPAHGRRFSHTAFSSGPRARS